MKVRPSYFERVRREASERWDQLERDPVLAGPWVQLFRQVQYPQHVLSELLQNADDAGAREVVTYVEGDRFIFEHDGPDFTESDLESLCRFGFSHKRVLHTIGFRGVGFKSVFSLGPTVEVHTPSLSLAFHEKRFTEPRWVEPEEETNGRTRIVCRLRDQYSKQELLRNFEEWRRNPLALLFLTHVRRMRIGDHWIQWEKVSEGPAPRSEVYRSRDDTRARLILFRSNPEPFPSDALKEIREERLLSQQEVLDLPPSSVQIVLGAPGRLYVVLPTGVETELPFACNAPFIQDPARASIKDPALSPTNRWLLERFGRLAAEAMLAWLNRSDLTMAERTRAYDLAPPVAREQGGLPAACETAIVRSFERTIANRRFLLTFDGRLVQAGSAVRLPRRLFDVWPAEQLGPLFDSSKRPALCPDAPRHSTQRLVQRGLLPDVGQEEVLELLRKGPLPRPPEWDALLRLWGYVQSIAPRYHWQGFPELYIIPTEGSDKLWPARSVVRLAEDKTVAQEDDWNFLRRYISIVHRGWLEFLGQPKAADQRKTAEAPELLQAAWALLARLALDQATDVNRVIELAAGSLFRSGPSVADAVRLTQIAARWRARVPYCFYFANRKNQFQWRQEPLIWDEDGALEELLPEDQRDTLLLHPAYFSQFTSCNLDDWREWVRSGRTPLLECIPLLQRSSQIYTRQRAEEEARARGGCRPLEYPYRSERFRLTDWDFREEFWQWWGERARSDPRFWLRIGTTVLRKVEYYGAKARAELYQVSTAGFEKPSATEPLLPSWILRLRELPCLPDEYGNPCAPADLLLRSKSTEALLGVESFVAHELDNERTRDLLKLLGVSDVPRGPAKLLERLRALARASSPPTHEVEKIYRKLDQLYPDCSTEDQQLVRAAFTEEKLILDDGGHWRTKSGVFLNAQGLPDVPVIREAVRNLSLWQRVGVAEQPSVEAVVEYLRTIPAGRQLAAEDREALGCLLRLYPSEIWRQVGLWLNLAGEWTPTDELRYKVAPCDKADSDRLHLWVKQQAADLRFLRPGMEAEWPFTGLESLVAALTLRLEQPPEPAGPRCMKEWMRELGSQLLRITWDSEEQTQQVREHAWRLAATEWCTVSGKLHVAPYLDGKPAGLSSPVDVHWGERQLFVREGLGPGRMSKLVIEELARPFDNRDIRDALAYCYERSPEQVRRYVEENFDLAASAPPTLPDDSPEPGSFTIHVQPGRRRETISEDESAHEVVVTSRGGQSGTRERKIAPRVLLEYARHHGFTMEAADQFRAGDGRLLCRRDGERSLWVIRSPEGNDLQMLYAQDHCLERRPLEVPHGIWLLLENGHVPVSWILEAPQGGFVEWDAETILAMVKAGKLILYPATHWVHYRP